MDSDCSHEIKTSSLLGRKAITNLDSVLKSRDITLQTKVCRVKAMAFLIVIYWCKSWSIKKAEHWRIDAFELWCWRRLFESPLDSKEFKPLIPRGNQSWIFIGRTDAEAPILWPPVAKSWLIWKDPDTGKDWGQEAKEQQTMRWLDGITISSVQFSLSVVSDSLQPNELQHARPPCPSPTPRVHPNPYPLSWWCHPTSHPLSSPSPALNLSQHQGLFK